MVNPFCVVIRTRPRTSRSCTRFKKKKKNGAAFVQRLPLVFALLEFGIALRNVRIVKSICYMGRWCRVTTSKLQRSIDPNSSEISRHECKKISIAPLPSFVFASCSQYEIRNFKQQYAKALIRSCLLHIYNNEMRFLS